MRDETVQGSLRAEPDGGVVRLEVPVDSPADEVWSALTGRDRLRAWLGTLEDGLDGELRAVFTATGWRGTLEVEACEPGRRLLVRTRCEGEPDCLLEVRLEADGAQTRVVVEDRGLPVSELAAYGAGDQVLLEGLLAHLAGRPLPDTRSRWTELVPGYRERAAALD